MTVLLEDPCRLSRLGLKEEGSRAEGLVPPSIRIGQFPDVLNRRDRVEHARDDLSGACAMRLVRETLFEQFGVGEDDA